MISDLAGDYMHLYCDSTETYNWTTRVVDLTYTVNEKSPVWSWFSKYKQYDEWWCCTTVFETFIAYNFPELTLTAGATMTTAEWREPDSCPLLK